MIVCGEFDVSLSPLDSYSKGANGVNLGRMSISKTFHGELSATSTGEMLSVMTSTDGSAGYVAIEQVTGRLGGKEGSFVLQHYGIMSDGESRLILEVVPKSGTGDLSAISGEMKIVIEDGKHFYEFDYNISA